MSNAAPVIQHQYERSARMTAIDQAILHLEGKGEIAATLTPRTSWTDQRMELAEWLELVAHMVDPDRRRRAAEAGYRWVPGMLVAKLRAEQRNGADHTERLTRVADHLRSNKLDRKDGKVLRSLARTTEVDPVSSYSKLYEY